jgi:SAM-dependent methyltransferase
VTSPPSLSSTYERALDTLTKEGTKLDAPALVLKLRKAFPNSDTRELNLAVETYIARREAPDKLGDWAREGHFSLSLLQQASRVSIASYRARYFAGRKHVLEVGTGTGSDTAALARVAEHVTTIEGDPETCELAKRNLALQGISNVTFLVGRAEDIILSLPPSYDALFADPMRRTKSGERVWSGEDYAPPLSFLLSLSIGSLRAIKISPGLFIEPCPEGWTRQFVGYGEECLEQTLWFGSPVADSSIVVTDRNVEWSPADGGSVPLLAESFDGFIVEAHATINRCQHLAAFFAERKIKPVADDVAYGICQEQPERSELLSSYKIIESLPYSAKNLKPVLARLGWSNRTEFKKRNFSGDIEQIRTELGLPKHTHTAPFGVVFFFRYHNKPWAVVAERLYEK